LSEKGYSQIVIDRHLPIGGFCERFNSSQRRLAVLYRCRSYMYTVARAIVNCGVVVCGADWDHVQALLPAGMWPWPTHLPPTACSLLRSYCPLPLARSQFKTLLHEAFKSNDQWHCYTATDALTKQLKSGRAKVGNAWLDYMAWHCWTHACASTAVMTTVGMT
jgi:hypothetical protein